jgi:hypothetical protein
MIPSLPEEITMTNIADRVKSMHSKLVFPHEASIIEKDISEARLGEMSMLAQALSGNSAIHEFNVEILKNKLSGGGHIFIAEMWRVEEILHMIPPKECGKFALVRVWTTYPPFGAIMLHKGKKKLLETLNLRIAERSNFLEQQLETLKPDPICMKNIAPTEKVVTEFAALTVSALSGSFALLVILLFCSLFVFLIKFIVFKFWKQSASAPNVTRKVITIEIDFLPSELEKYVAIFDEMSLNYRISY